MKISQQLVFLGFLNYISLTYSKPLRISGDASAFIYLAKFGHLSPTVLNPNSGALISEEAIREAIINFQELAGIDQTGELDDETIKMMNTPRCGVKDKVGFGSNARRKKRYALQGSRWRTRELTYRISKYPKGLTRSEVDIEVGKAFKVWEDVTDLVFKEASSGKIHIEIRFEKGEHGDGDPFDGPGGTLAHAYYPIYGGDAHFDETEAWTINKFRGTNLFQVAAHEFGHSLGLSHSDVKSALMAPFYRGYDPDFKLDSDDTTGIQALYGTKKSKPSPKPQPPTKPAISSLCNSATFDAIVTMSDKETYVFKGDEFWKLTDNGVASGYPLKVSTWKLESNLDAAFTWTNGKTYFFKDDKYWRFTDMALDPDYPKLISKGFVGIPDNVDAAFVWSGNGKIYFFKGSNYWRFDPSNRPPVKESYPKPISNWEGLPNDIDDALQYSNGYTYFFKKGKYWRFNDRAFRIDAADPAFPRPAGYWWFGCPASSAAQTAGLQGTQKKTVQIPGDEADESFDAESGNSEPQLGSSTLLEYFSSSTSHQGPSGLFTSLLVPIITLAIARI